ncbi:10521_t:CDS:2 [Diversispora eburnea]|uniref:10521_t:CDS:1 n=1 Tax=Diversispora eburnea TaxID=1213867 RepID=A0A9N9FH38_9GLOM|nr:10521_t:CDS:2 [Diversispora eburnea]
MNKSQDKWIDGNEEVNGDDKGTGILKLYHSTNEKIEKSSPPSLSKNNYEGEIIIERKIEKSASLNIRSTWSTEEDNY